MTDYRGKYFDGVHSEVHHVDVSIRNTVLEIRKGDVILDHWPLKMIFRDQAHLTKIVIGSKHEDEARLELADEGLLSDISKVTGLKYSGNSLKINKSGLALLIVGIIALVFLVTLGVRPLTRFVAAKISHQTEQKMLSALTSSMQPQFCSLNLEQSFVLEKALSRIYPQMAEDNLLPIEIHFLPNSEVNAFALPGAQIWIYEGLLKKSQSAEEFIGVLAHELEHVRQRHVLESVVRGVLWTSLLSLAVGDASGALLVDPQTAMTLLSMRYNRGMEDSADAGAMERLKKAKVSTQGMINFFERGQDTAFKPPAFLSTHPANSERAEKLKAGVLAEQDKVEVLTSREWNTLQSICD